MALKIRITNNPRIHITNDQLAAMIEDATGIPPAQQGNLEDKLRLLTNLANVSKKYTADWIKIKLKLVKEKEKDKEKNK